MRRHIISLTTHSLPTKLDRNQPTYLRHDRVIPACFVAYSSSTAFLAPAPAPMLRPGRRGSLKCARCRKQKRGRKVIYCRDVRLICRPFVSLGGMILMAPASRASGVGIKQRAFLAL